MILNGIVACNGKFKGRVRLITNLKDVSKVREGDIVVTNNNSPLFSLAFLKASAIISEKGGVLCHLAIVSREMQKPCILSVDNATKLLKDGELIELNADENKIVILENE